MIRYSSVAFSEGDCFCWVRFFAK